MRALAAQIKVETSLTLKRGESLLLTLGIPVAFLVFFSTVHVVATPTRKPVAFFVPGILALAVMSTSMVSLGIATGFERGYRVLKRLGFTPLGRPRLLAAKTATIVLVEAVQVVVLVVVGLGLGWRAAGSDPAGGVGLAAVAMVLASVGFAGIGLTMAGVLRAEVNLAAANGLYLVLLLLGGMVVPLTTLPGALATVAGGLPGGALSTALHATLGTGTAVPVHAWVVLALWAAGAPAVAAATFRWE